MKKSLQEIQQALQGEVSIDKKDLEYYATDGGVFELMPEAIVFPKDTLDVQNLVKVVQEINAKATNESDRISITARGNGTDQGGGPINTGIIVDFMRHMNHIIEIGDNHALVEPGCLFGRLQNELKEREQFIPSYPASIDVSTIGGAVANNAAGEKTVKYGATRKYVESVQVVLADGTLTWLHAVKGHELTDKKTITGLEGEIYRDVDRLIDENNAVINSKHPHTTKESAGYALWKAKNNHELDLAQIITGSQGTLCFITAIRLRTIPLPDPRKTTLLVSYYDDLRKAGVAAQEIHKLNPSALEIVDKNLIELVNTQKPELLEGLLPDDGQIPAVVLLTEFDDQEQAENKAKEKRALTIIEEHAFSSVVKHTPEEEAQLWKLRRSAAAVMWTIPGSKKALPIIEDGTVPPNKLVEFIERAYKIFEKYDLEIAIWGHAGDADLHMQPFMDLTKESDRKKLFDVTDDFYAMVHELGGTAAGEHNDSLMRAPYRAEMFGPEMEELFNQVKRIFDPGNLFNPHKKVGVDFNYIKEHLRHEYSIKSLEHLERQQAQDTIDR